MKCPLCYLRHYDVQMEERFGSYVCWRCGYRVEKIRGMGSDKGGKMKGLITLLLSLGCIGCNGNMLRTSPRSVVKYEGETISYYMKASETFYNNYCLERRITLKHKNKPHTNYEVSFVEAVDRQCDGIIESFRFRDFRDNSVDKIILEQDIIFMFYGIKYGKIRR